MVFAIEFFESQGFEFEKDKYDLWKEEFVPEMKWKDLFLYMESFPAFKNMKEEEVGVGANMTNEDFISVNTGELNTLKSKAAKFDLINKHYDDTVELNDACEFGLFVCSVVNPYC